MSGSPWLPPTGGLLSHALDPVERRALHQALSRLPAGAMVGGPEPLTPSIRAVLDRFLSTPLRRPLRALGEPNGPAAVVMERLGSEAWSVDGVLRDPTDALLAWLIEAAGLFRQRQNRGAGLDQQPGRRAGQPYPAPGSNHLLVLVRSSPPAGVCTVGFASAAEILMNLGDQAAELVRQPLFSLLPAADPARPSPAEQPLLSAGRNPRFLIDPNAAVGVDHRAEKARQAVIAAAKRVEIAIELTVGTVVLVDRRRAFVPSTGIGPVGHWLTTVDLVADPWSSDQNRVDEWEGGRP